MADATAAGAEAGAEIESAPRVVAERLLECRRRAKPRVPSGPYNREQSGE